MRTERAAKIKKSMDVAVKLLCLMACFLLLACGCEKEEELPLRQQLEENLKNAKSLESHTKLTLDYTMGQRFFFESETSCTTTGNPWLFDAKSTWKTDVLNMEKSVDRRFMGEEKDGKIIFYRHYNGNWLKNSRSGNKMYQQYETMWQMEALIAALDSLKQGSSRMEENVELLRFDGVAPAELVEKILMGDGCREAFGMEMCGKILAAASKGTSGAGASTDDSSDAVRLTLWVDMAKKLPVRYELDFSNAVRTVLKESGEKKTDVEEACLKCQITAYDKIDEIKIPTWAASSPEM